MLLLQMDTPHKPSVGKQFTQYPILGMGFINGNQNLSGWQLLMGNDRRFYRSDVGVVGLLNEIGLLGFIWTGYFFVLGYKNIKRKKSLNANIVRYFLIYLAISMINF